MSEQFDPGYVWFGLPLCKHRVQFDCQQCELDKVYTENRRMSWLLQSAMSPHRPGYTMWEEYTDLDENFWGRQGL